MASTSGLERGQFIADHGFEIDGLVKLRLALTGSLNSRRIPPELLEAPVLVN